VRRLRDPRWQRVATLALTETVSWGVLYYTFSVLVVPMEGDLGASRGQIALAFSVAVVLRAVASPVAGWWVDRHGVRSLMTAGSLAGVGLTLAWSAVTDLLQLYVVFAGIGVVTAMVLYEPAFAAVARWMRRSERAAAVLWITLAAGFASTIFMPIAALLTESLGWRGALRWLAVVVLVLTALPHALLSEPRHVPVGAGNGVPGTLPAAHAAAAASAGDGDGHGDASVPTRAALRDGTFWWMTLAFVCGRVPIVAVSTHLPALLVERGEAAAVAATITGLIGALSVTGRVILTLGARWTSFENLLASVYVLQTVGVLVLAFVPGRTAVAVFVLTFGLGFGATTITKPVMVANGLGPLATGCIAGIIAAVTTAGEAASPVLVGISRDLTGVYRTSMLALGLVLALGAYAARRCHAAPPPKDQVSQVATG
jgi:predicted MFS family arabinose efflux permease